MSDRKQRLREITDRIDGVLAPVTFIVPLNGALAVRLMSEAGEAKIKPETVIAEAVRAYMGDA